MVRVYLGLGSNLQPEENLRLGIRELSRRFSLKAVSPVYQNQAFGFEGEDFLNAVACVETDTEAEVIGSVLNEIHEIAGRERGSPDFASRTLDIDLLLYGDEIIPALRVPRADILEYSFVLCPLADLAPDLAHPVTGRAIGRHWVEFDASSHTVTRTTVAL